jgi:uncharacterized protein (DUF2384 family)
MAIRLSNAEPGHEFDAIPDLSRLETRERLSQSAIDGFFAITDKWQVPIKRAGDLLGGMPRSTVYKLKTAARTLRQDELTRISHIVGLYKVLHMFLPDQLADEWVARPNDNYLFGGLPPLDYIVRAGIPGLLQVRSLVDAACSGS